MYGLEEKYIEFIKGTIKTYFPDDDIKCYIFGSRAKGEYQEYSDIDIALQLGDVKISIDKIGQILMAFKDSTLPYEVDVIDLNSIDNKFKNIIQDSLIELI